jgi:hypothetical protein
MSGEALCGKLGYKNAAGRQQKSNAKVDRLQLIRACGLGHSNGSVQGIVGLVIDPVLILPLAAQALRIVQVAVEG